MTIVLGVVLMHSKYVSSLCMLSVVLSCYVY